MLRQRARPCWRKQHYTKPAQAIAHLESLLSADYVENPDLLRAYKCRHCGLWAVGRVTE